MALFAAMLALAAAWTLEPNAPPIYDGLPLGAPPYRYLHPGPGVAATPAPTSASKTFQIAGTPFGFELTTQEPDPQADVLVPLASLLVPAGVTSVVVSLRPVDPPAAAPAGTVVDGNTYAVALTGNGSPVPVRSGDSVRVTLRHTGAPGQPRLAYFNGTSWRTVHSIEEVSGSSTGDVPRFGDVALLLSTSSEGGLGRPLELAIVVAGVLLVMALVLVLIGRRRRN